MLVVTMEIWPGGDESRKRHLGTAKISNNGSHPNRPVMGNYNASFSKWGRPDDTWKRSQVIDFNRKRRGPWDLLFVALRSAVGYRNADI